MPRNPSYDQMSNINKRLISISADKKKDPNLKQKKKRKKMISMRVQSITKLKPSHMAKINGTATIFIFGHQFVPKTIMNHSA